MTQENQETTQELSGLAGARETLREMLKVYSVRITPDGSEPFLLASGGFSRLYINAKTTILHREATKHLASCLLAEIAPFRGIDTVAGVALGGCHMASLVAMASTFRGPLMPRFNVVYVRKSEKDHGTRQAIDQPFAHRWGERVVLFEDVISTGASVAHAVHALRDEGYHVAEVVALVDRRLLHDKSTLKGLMDLTVRAVFDLESLGIDEETARITYPQAGR